jgi:Ni/Fe-hydrogenase subunit HybB-like protein
MAYQETYQYAWLAYLLASVGMYYVVVKMSKYWKSENLKSYWKMISAVILFTPAVHVAEGITVLAPAYIVALGELFQNGPKAAMLGLVPLLFALLLGSVLLAIQAFVKSKKASKQVAKY